jgi:hypothetical protein
MKIGNIGYNTNTEEGYVKIDWRMMPKTDDVVTLDILKDWIYDLEKIYDEKREKVFKQKE